MMDASPIRGTQPETVSHFVKITGTNGTGSKTLGPGLSLTYVSEGAYDLVWAEAQGTFLGATYGLQATTQADLKGYTAVIGAFNTTTRTLRVVVYDSAFAAADLLANQWLMLNVLFKTTAV